MAPPREPDIRCAAIWVDDGKHRYHQPVNILCGLVFCGLRHCSILQQIEGMEGKKVQGFLTSDNDCLSGWTDRPQETKAL